MQETALVVKKSLKKGDQIPSHNHPDMSIYFTVQSGEVNIHLDETETHTLKGGEFHHFFGERYISAEALSDAEIVVFLAQK